MIVSGGLPDQGGAVFLYQSKSIEGDWTFVSTFIQGKNPDFQLPGKNWECCNFITLRNEKTSQDFIFTGVDRRYIVMVMNSIMREIFMPLKYLIVKIKKRLSLGGFPKQDLKKVLYNAD